LTLFHCNHPFLGWIFFRPNQIPFHPTLSFPKFACRRCVIFWPRKWLRVWCSP
jgi:hypothetical protein